MIRRIALIISALILVFIGFVIWSKVPSPDSENTVIIEGVVAGISSPCCNDIVFLLEGDDHLYYINHGLDYNLPYLAWNESMKGKKIKLEWIETRWNPFNASGIHRPVSKVIYEDVELYDMISMNSMAAIK